MFGCLGDFGIAERALPHRVFGTRAIFRLLLTLPKLLIMQQSFFKFIIIPIIFGLQYFLCTGKGSGSGSAVTSAYGRTTSPRLDRGLHHHLINPHRGLWRHTVGLHWPCYVATSECRALRSATSGPAWGLGPCHAVSSAVHRHRVH